MAIPLVLMPTFNMNTAFATEQNIKTVAEVETQEVTNQLVYWCSATGKHPLGGTIERDLPLIINLHTVAPKTVLPEEEVTIESYAELTLIEKVNQGLGENNITKLSGTVTEFNLVSQNENKTINAADPIISIPEQNIPKSGSLTVRLPSNGVLKTGTFIAGNNGELEINAGTEQGDIKASLLGKAYGVISVNLSATCELVVDKDNLPEEAAELPTSDPSIITIPINSDGEPGGGEEPTDPTNPGDGNGDGKEPTDPEEPGDGNGNGEDPTDPATEALKAVNDANDIEALWAAFANEDLGLNLIAVRNYTTFQKTLAGEWIIENR